MQTAPLGGGQAETGDAFLLRAAYAERGAQGRGWEPARFSVAQGEREMGKASQGLHQGPRGVSESEGAWSQESGHPVHVCRHHRGNTLGLALMELEDFVSIPTARECETGGAQAPPQGGPAGLFSLFSPLFPPVCFASLYFLLSPPPGPPLLALTSRLLTTTPCLLQLSLSLPPSFSSCLHRVGPSAGPGRGLHSPQDASSPFLSDLGLMACLCLCQLSPQSQMAPSLWKAPPRGQPAGCENTRVS